MDIALKQRIVLVDASFSQGDPQRGTGLHLHDGWILTSQHVVERQEEGAGTEGAVSIKVTKADPAGEGPKRAGAEVRWRGEEQLDPDQLRGLDAALLWCGALSDGELERIQMVPTHLPSGGCEITGWLGSSPLTEEVVAPEEWSGRFDAIEQGAAVLPLTLQSLEPKPENPEAPPYGGLSGAPLLVASGRYEGWLYGLIRKGPKEQGDRLYAVSTPALLRRRTFRQKLGLKDPPPPHEALFLASRQLLQQEPHLAEQLAQADSRWRGAWEEDEGRSGVDGLLAALGEVGDLKKVLAAIDVMTREAREHPERQNALRKWAGHLTALLAHRFLAGTGRELSAKGHRVVVPVDSPGMAEATLAAEKGESPLYERREGEPRALLEVPISKLEAGIRVSGLAEDQMKVVAHDLLRKDLLKPRFFTKAELEILSGEEDVKQFETLLQAIGRALAGYSEGKETERRPYMLVTKHLRKHSINSTLDAFLGYLGDLLPDLHQFELTGEAGEGIELEQDLRILWRILDIEKE